MPGQRKKFFQEMGDPLFQIFVMLNFLKTVALPRGIIP